MTIINFIKEELVLFLDQFKMAKVRFGVDWKAHVYTVEISPSELIERDDVFDWVDSIVTEAINRFPDELLCIREEDSLLGVGKPLFEREGLEYEPISRCYKQASTLSNFTAFVSDSIMRSPNISIVDNNEHKPYPIITKEGSMVVSSQFTKNQLAA